MNSGIRFLFLATVSMAAVIAQPPVQSDEKAAPKTQLETFLARKGSIIVKEFHPLGTVEGAYGTSAKLDTLALYEPGKEQQRKAGIRIEVQGGGRLERENTSFLDMDEIDSLMKGLDYMTKVIADWEGSKRDYTEMIFSTKGEFDVGFYLKEGKIQAFVTSGTIGPATAYIQPSGLAMMRQFLEQGRSLLGTKPAQ